MLRVLAYIFASAVLVSAAVKGTHQPRSLPPNPPLPEIFDNVTVWTPPDAYPWKDHSGGTYGRSVLLNQNCETGIPTILATAMYNPADGQYLQIFQSKDYGLTWSLLSKAYFNGNASITGGYVYQPFLYELPHSVGSFPAGTIILSGNRLAAGYTWADIQIHASRDKGVTWEYVSSVVKGGWTKSGGPEVGGSHGIVFEPFILSYDNTFAVYYSDESDPRYSQKLAHRTSKDLITWSATVDDVTNANADLRPGMITIAPIANNKWIASYEMGPNADPKATWAAFYRIADSPFKFLDALEYELRADTGEIANAGPYPVWTPAGGENGTIVVSDSSNAGLFLNTKNGDAGAWKLVASGQEVGYTRSLSVLPGRGGKVVQVLNGGKYNQDNTHIEVGDFVVPGPEGKGPGAQGFPACNRI
ncbi:unnamed protein product [Zymoseptoria tritici ST99CH_3D1]|uniref:Glycoside hydrolase family 93 protein n=2 Tax=Zymoseptoria tritici TaxID=1047171 RepID=F9XHG7_ZYMTI|nr:uncharacterized protein MYCGRDRAFT_95102 [Zymoseptoria tritici IPO323]EGP84977.1 hypothetical protein MYCGRDRAFT_95102 [Zymoseptoria tritici IPO323]SMR56872.1 unnamed protein product [Zymoseptoria tritici ST99CH_1E4]SMR59731.1 unnamed protein product [Zymoseptoria tritici ST99CH_3D1]